MNSHKNRLNIHHKPGKSPWFFSHPHPPLTVFFRSRGLGRGLAGATLSTERGVGAGLALATLAALSEEVEARRGAEAFPPGGVGVLGRSQREKRWGPGLNCWTWHVISILK